MRPSLHLFFTTNVIRYHTLWRNRHRSPVSRLDWISMELTQDSELYSETVKCIFSLIHIHFSKSALGLIMLGVSLSLVASIQHPTPSRQARCAPSRFSIESGTNGASSLHTVPPSSQQLVPSYQVSLSGQQPFDNVVEARTNTAKRRKISGHAASQTRESLCMIQEDNQSTSTPRSEASLTDTHGEHQALDVTMAANVLHSLQHGNQGYMGVVAAQLELRVQSQPSPSTSNSTLAQRNIAENGGTRSASADDHQVSGDDSAGLDLRLRHLSTSRHGRPKPDQQHFPDHLELLPDGQVDEVHPGETTLINRVSGVTALESEQALVADELFLSDFMQEYREMM
jgi:hypothetical protein